MTNSGRNISLVLGSGGARGLAHIGVIRWLEENGYRIESLVGCSMGACVGGIHAIGRLEEYEDWVRAIRKRDIVALLDLSWPRGGLVKGDRLINTLRELLGDARIEDLPIRYTAVAVDIHRSREVWLSRGLVFDAIRASVSIPMLFTPVRQGNRLLIDGGVMNPIPIAPTLSDMTDRVIAVNASGELREGYRRASKQPRSSEKTNALHARISQFLESFSTNRHEEDEEEATIKEVIYTAFDAMQSTIARQKLAAYPPDVLIDIPRNVANMMEFDRADELIDLGYEATERAMKRL